MQAKRPFPETSPQARGLAVALALLGAAWPAAAAGWGFNATVFKAAGASLRTSQSWMVALQWADALVARDALGLAAGQPVFATGLRDGANPKDGNFAWEAWYRLPMSDAIAITAGVFTLSRPLGSQTPAGQTFSPLAGVLKLSFAF